MNKRVKKLCELCREADKAYREYGALEIGGVSGLQVHLNVETFFKYFDRYETGRQSEKYTEFFRIIDGIRFFCLVGKGEIDDE